jgi:hypothetical protein
MSSEPFVYANAPDPPSDTICVQVFVDEQLYICCPAGWSVAKYMLAAVQVEGMADNMPLAIPLPDPLMATGVIAVIRPFASTVS